MTQYFSNSMERIHYIHSIDVLKLFFALCIVILHGHAYLWLPSSISFAIEKLVLRIAVPFFFVTSGFFWDRSVQKRGRIALATYVRRLLYPLIVFETINILLQAILAFVQGSLNASFLADALQHIVFYPYGALWYVQASLIGAFLLYPFIVRKNLNLALLVGIILYSFALLCNNYFFLIQRFPIVSSFIQSYMSIFLSGRNGVFVGFLFLGLGAKCFEEYECGKGRSIKLQGLLLLFTFSLYVLEVYLIKGRPFLDDGALYITHVVLLPSLLMFCTTVELNISNGCSRLLRNLSTGIYFQHRSYLLGFMIISESFSIRIPSIFSCGLTILFSIIVCFVAYRTKREPFYSLLR